MQQVLFCARTSRVIDAVTRAAKRAIASWRLVADSESRVLATKLFSCLTAEALVRACARRRFARIARTAIRSLHRTRTGCWLLSMTRESVAS